MYGRALFFVALVVLGAVLPYWLADEDLMNRVRNWTGQFPSSVPVASGPSTSVPREVIEREPEIPTQLVGVQRRRRIGPPTSNVAPVTSVIPVGPLGSGAVATGPGRLVESTRATGPMGIPLEHLLSFAVTPEWIRSQWSRVTTSLAEIDLRGYRVPVALGSEPGDFAGSVTYYFDANQYVQRIVLHGFVAEPKEIIDLATNRYRMVRVPTVVDDLYRADVQGETLGGLQICCGPMIKDDRPNDRYRVLMELNREGSKYGMSQEFQRTLRRAVEQTPL